MNQSDLKDEIKSELIDDILFISKELDYLWKFHSKNPNKISFTKYYNTLKQNLENSEQEYSRLKL